MPIFCCIGITAFNEESNIGQLLTALLEQETNIVNIESIIVVSSGCTDRTESIVSLFIEKDPRIQLVKQVRREGKASAVNLFLKSTDCDVLVIHSADTVPEKNTIENLVAPFQDPMIGMTGGRPVPINSKETFWGYGVHLLWDLHHKVSLISPKMGELIAFRHIFHQIPFDTAVDEASIEPLIIGQGLRRLYVPEAVVYNRGPSNFKDFLKQRRRIFIGHLYIKEMLGYQVSTMNSLRIAWLYLRNFKLDWRYILWAPAFGLLELTIRGLAVFDYYILKQNPYNWSISGSTKGMIENKEIKEQQNTF